MTSGATIQLQWFKTLHPEYCESFGQEGRCSAIVETRLLAFQEVSFCNFAYFTFMLIKDGNSYF